MTILKQTYALRNQLTEWATNPDRNFFTQYDLLRYAQNPWLRIQYWFNRVACIFKQKKYRKYSWNPTLKHAPVRGNYKTLLIWSDITEIAASREACNCLKIYLDQHKNLCPVLVTSLADFSFYSRLCWLVEYLPPLDILGYRDYKARYLAWRYADAIAIPLSAGLAPSQELEQLLQETL